MSDGAPWEQWITLDSIKFLYLENMRRWGGPQSEPVQGCIEGALGAAYSAELYSTDVEQEGFVQGLLFAAYLLFYVATKHCFVDGNKRLAWACMTFVLLNFGLTVTATDDEAEAFCIQIAKGEIKETGEVMVWLYPRLVSLI